MVGENFQILIIQITGKCIYHLWNFPLYCDGVSIPLKNTNPSSLARLLLNLKTVQALSPVLGNPPYILVFRNPH